MIRPYRRFTTQKGNPVADRVSPRPAVGTPSLRRVKMKKLNTITGRTIGGLLIVAVFLGACSHANGKKAAPSRTGGTVAAIAPSATSTTTGPSADLAAAVEAAYRDATAAEFAFDSEVGPFDPVAFKERVGRFLTGAQYNASFQLSQERRLRGEVFRPPGLQSGEIAPVVAMDGPGKATVRDCEADHPTVKAATGERVDQPMQGRELVIVEMILEDGQWKISNTTAQGQPCSA